jgi:hypothetical protein
MFGNLRFSRGLHRIGLDLCILAIYLVEIRMQPTKTNKYLPGKFYVGAPPFPDRKLLVS